MSLIGNFFGDKEPDEGYLDDQSMQEDRRNDRFVGPSIDTACAVYDTMFDALKYLLRGKADAIANMDRMVGKLEARCKIIAERYAEMLAGLKAGDSGFTSGLTLDVARTAFTLLDSNPILRRYAGEANYWALWDTLAIMSSQGAAISADIMASLKGAIKATIYAMLSMTDGLMHFEAYLTQLTQLWGWLYAKEIRLPLTDSVCPQVTCEYFYKPEDNGQLEGSRNSGLDRYNPAPGPGAFAPIPAPIFDYEHATPAAIEAFRYDNPDTWTVLTSKSRAAFTKAYKYWRSNYTDATSLSTILSAMANRLSGGLSVGFGPRKTNHPLGTPLRVGSTFAQLYTDKDESFPVTLYDDEIADRYSDADKAFMALLAKMQSAEVSAERDAAYVAGLEHPENYAGSWAYLGRGTVDAGNEEDGSAWGICYGILLTLEEYSAFKSAIYELSVAYNGKYGAPYHTGIVPNWGRPQGDGVWGSPLLEHLVDIINGAIEDAPVDELSELMDRYNSSEPELGLPYAFYTDSPDAYSEEIYEYLAEYLAHPHEAPLYTASANALSAEIDVDDEIGRKVDGGRRPLFAVIGVYGDLKALCPWEYEVVPYPAFKAQYKRIRGNYRIYYNRSRPDEVRFADHVIRVGLLKYVATCRPAYKETVSRGEESYVVHVFPSESCAVSVLDSPRLFGKTFPSFSSLQHADVIGPDGARYKYDLMANTIPRWPKYVDPEKWSVMDLIHELWLLADGLTPLCGDGGRRKAELNDLLEGLGLSADGAGNGPKFIGQLPGDDGAHVRMEFTAMNEFASRIKAALDSVYNLRSELLKATHNW